MADVEFVSHHANNMFSEPTTPVTPVNQIRSFSSGTSTSSMSDQSASEIKRKLELRLADTKTKMYNIGKLGESLVKQEKELSDRIREMESGMQGDDEIRHELRSKLAELESGFKEIERESAKVFAKTVPFFGKVQCLFSQLCRGINNSF